MKDACMIMVNFLFTVQKSYFSSNLHALFNNEKTQRLLGSTFLWNLAIFYSYKRILSVCVQCVHLQFFSFEEHQLCWIRAQPHDFITIGKTISK
jgi:hypothetical protein